MSDLLGGVLGNTRGVLVGWIVPFALVASLFAGLVLPSWQGRPATDTLASLSGYPECVVFLVGVVGGGLVLNALQTPLYRLLEGHLLWPGRLVALRTETHRARRDRLRELADAHRGVRRTLARERPRRYPVADDDLTATSLGNAIRRFETYAFDRFRLDSQLVWHELRALAPGHLTEEERHARSAVDFFVCLFYSLVLLTLCAVVTLVAGGPEPLRLTLTFLASGGTAVLAYQGAVVSTDHWAAAVRALVHLGRIPLARSLGLVIPAALEDEREMWRRVNWLVRLDFDPRLAPELNPYRLRPVGTAESPAPTGPETPTDSETPTRTVTTVEPPSAQLVDGAAPRSGAVEADTAPGP